MDFDTPILSAHIEETVRSIAEFRAAHDRRATLYQRIVARLIENLGRPASVGVVLIIMLLWIAANLIESHLHLQPFDPTPFAYLQGLVTAAALFMTVLILSSQRRENRLAEHRAQRTLELSMLSEQKIAKLIELVEHQRRDPPQLRNTMDEGSFNTKPAITEAVTHLLGTHCNRLPTVGGFGRRNPP